VCGQYCQKSQRKSYALLKNLTMMNGEFKQARNVPQVGSGDVQEQVHQPAKGRRWYVQLRGNENDACDGRSQQRHNKECPVNDPFAWQNAVNTFKPPRPDYMWNCFNYFVHDCYKPKGQSRRNWLLLSLARKVQFGPDPSNLPRPSHRHPTTRRLREPAVPYLA